ncbi:MAG TPA: hypothetical protein PL009_01585 [Flavipsychrobacter sp.]|nr:hypothetical protein [Flavipsychrobacter sp.]
MDVSCLNKSHFSIIKIPLQNGGIFFNSSLSTYKTAVNTNDFFASAFCGVDIRVVKNEINMSYWTIPQEMQMPMNSRNVNRKKNSLFFNLFIPFALAVIGIPFYLMILLKVIGMMM